uniref:Uncharacterized protein n=1 Tax=Anguilla anguilla TaxID=7936 RepID=A0A0E9SRI9_ANGAN
MLSAISAAAVKIASESIPLLLSHHAYLQSFNIRCFDPFLFTSDVLTTFFPLHCPLLFIYVFSV